MSKAKIFLTLCLGLIVGVFAGRFINYEIMAVAAMIFIIVATIGWDNKFAVVVGLTGLVALGGALRFKLDYAKNDIAPFYNHTAQVVGVITDEPDERDDKTYLTLGQLKVNDQLVESKILITVGKFPEYEYGQKLNFQSKISEPKEYPDFSYKNYLSRFGIDAVATPQMVEVIPGNFGNPVKLQILRLKKNFVTHLGQLLPEPQNSFLAGLLLGAKKQIPQALTDEFARTGTSHIVAISGYNITIIAAAIDWLFAWLGVRKKISFGISVLAIVMFVVMTGASASAVRAGVMGILLLLALNVGRVSVAANSLAFTAVVMLLLNPQILAFDVGFQLSFAALLGIIYLMPMLEPHFLWLPKLVRQYLLATLSAQIWTLPILLFNFGQLSIIALIPNVLVLPLVPWTMLFGFLTGILALVWTKLAIPLAWLTWLCLTYILKVIGWFASLPFAAISWKISFWLLALYYFVLCSLLLMHYFRETGQKVAFGVNLPQKETETNEF